MEKEKIWKKEVKFHFILNLLFAIFITLSSYVHIPYGTFKAFLFYLVHFLLLQFSFSGFIYILSLFRKIFVFVFPLFFLVLSSLSFWVYTQDITIGMGLIQAILETKLDIAIDVLNVQFIGYLLVAVVSLFMVMKKFNSLPINRFKSPLLLVAIFAISTFFLVENYKYGTFKRKLPYNAYFAFTNYLKKPNLKLKEVPKNIVSKSEGVDIIFVLGESLRADHLYLNGYTRNTTPLLSKQKNIVSFNNIYTPLTYTAISVPQILTNKSVLDEDKQDFFSLYSVLRKANFSTKWLGNQTLEKSFKDIVYTNDSVQIIDQFRSVLSFKKQKDMELLNFFSNNTYSAKNSITTLHMIGSHWYYGSRITKNFEYYKPTVQSKYVGSSTKEALINSYDNTILYLDYFLENLIERLKTSSKKTILIYLSDHGETLGEDGKWFHAQEHKSSKNPAMLVWYSDNFAKYYPNKIKQLKSKQKMIISTDFLFHTILDLAEIENFNFKKELSIFN